MKKTLFVVVLCWILQGLSAQQLSNQLAILPETAIQPVSYRVSLTAIDSLAFGVSIVNRGTRRATNVKLTVTVKDTFGIVRFQTSRNFGTLQPDSLIQNQPLTPNFLPERCVLNTMTVGYKVSSDSLDQSPNDDTTTVKIIRNQSILQNYRQDDKPTWYFPKGVLPTGARQATNIGMVFRVKFGTQLRVTGADVFLRKTALNPANYTMSLYSWDDRNKDGRIQADERTVVAAGESNAQRPTSTQPFWLPFIMENAQSAGPIILSAETTYLLAFQWIPTANPIADTTFLGIDTSYNVAYHLNQHKLAGLIRYHAAMPELPSDNGSALTWTTTRDTFGNVLDNRQPIMRLRTRECVHCCFGATEEATERDYKLTIVPNPAVEETTIGVDLSQNPTDVSIAIYNLSGQLMAEKQFKNDAAPTWKLPLSNLPSGVYVCRVQTQAGFQQRRFVVLKN